jgi:cold shock protein
MRKQPARMQWHLSQITDEIEPSERGQHVLGARRKSERRTRKLRYAKPSAPKPRRRQTNPPLRKSKADTWTLVHISAVKRSAAYRPLFRLGCPRAGFCHWLLAIVALRGSNRQLGDSAMASGTVKWFNSQKGYGFIQPTGGGRDVFVHISAVERAGLSSINEGQHVEFEIEDNRGITSAVNLRAR